MAHKVLVAEIKKCGGCRLCELICSWTHNLGEIKPSASRIHVFADERQCIHVPMFCVQCEDPPCAQACEFKAISRDETMGVILISPELCIGCRLCAWACPWVAIGFDPDNGEMIKCDLCGGDPQCVQWCPRGALEYGTAERIAVRRQRDIVEKQLIKALSKTKKPEPPIKAGPTMEEFVRPKREG